MIKGKWKITECVFKVQGWHTDMTNGIYDFQENNILRVNPNNPFDKNQIESKFLFDGITLTFNSIKYDFKKISKNMFVLENDLVVLKFVPML